MQKLPIDALKIDRSFVTSLNGDQESLGIVETVLSLGKNLGLTVIAEGIETEAQLKRLRTWAAISAKVSTSVGRCRLKSSFEKF